MFPYSDYIIIPALIIAGLYVIDKGDEHKVTPIVIGSIITIFVLLLFIMLRKYTEIRTGILILIVVVIWIGLTLLKNLILKKSLY